MKPSECLDQSRGQISVARRKGFQHALVPGFPFQREFQHIVPLPNFFLHLSCELIHWENISVKKSSVSQAHGGNKNTRAEPHAHKYCSLSSHRENIKHESIFERSSNKKKFFIDRCIWMVGRTHHSNFRSCGKNSRHCSCSSTASFRSPSLCNPAFYKSKAKTKAKQKQKQSKTRFRIKNF